MGANAGSEQERPGSKGALPGRVQDPVRLSDDDQGEKNKPDPE
jgi:hypothetical protein